MTDQEINKNRSSWPLPFLTLWTVQTLAMITSEIVQFSLVWWLTDTYGSGTIVGWATMITLLPRAILNPVIGALVDRWNRQKILLASHMIIILMMLYLGNIFRAPTIPVGIVFLVIFICALSKGFQSPVILSSTALMVPEKYISRIAGLNQLQQGAMRVIAPSIGAVLLLLLPMSDIVVVDIVGSSLGLLSLVFVNIPNPVPAPNPSHQTSSWKHVQKDIHKGIRYIVKWPGAVEMLSLSTMVNFLSCPAFMLVSLLVSRDFGGSESAFGAISSAIGAGMICGGIVLSFWSGFRKPMLTSLMGVMGMAIALLVTGMTPATSFWLAVVSMFTAGFMIPVSMAPIQALVQKSVEPGMQGRILSLLDCVSTTISPISLAIAGLFFDLIGPRDWYTGSGVLILFVGITAILSPKLKSFGYIEIETNNSNPNISNETHGLQENI